MSNDYRNTKYCPKLENLVEKKVNLVRKIKKDHPKARDFHSLIHKNEGSYKIEFMKAYNCKCAYCGVAISILPKEMFEIDHFVYEKSFPCKSDAGYIENLVLACHSCNHKKSAFVITVENYKYLYPDENELLYTFFRDDMYYIRIADNHRENNEIKTFYEQLNLSGEIHRIDFLLMSMIGLQRKLEDRSKAYAKLGQAIEKLRFKRNIMI